MPAITATLVNEMRNKTGLPMMECKKALTESDGDVDKAIDNVRKKGVKTSVTERAASEGRVGVVVSPDGKSAAIVEVNCNTDFTAKSEPVTALIRQVGGILLANPSANLAADATIKAQLVSASQQTGENIQLGRTSVLANPTGKIGSYAHFNGKLGVLVSVAGNPSAELLKDLSFHIAGHSPPPLALTRDQLPADLVAKEREIAIEQSKNMGKPQAIAEKIAEGKMRTFYEERVLLDQKFVKDSSQTVAQLVTAAGCKVEAFVRIEVGK